MCAEHKRSIEILRASRSQSADIQNALARELRLSERLLADTRENVTQTREHAQKATVHLMAEQAMLHEEQCNDGVMCVQCME